MTDRQTTVVNLRKKPFDVYIGRRNIHSDGYFGNPFSVAKHGREKCLELYREYFYDRIDNDEEFRRRVLELRGRTLGCFCKPAACHGDIIAEYLDGECQ